MPKKSVVLLDNRPAPFVGAHAVGGNGYCFCPIAVAPFGPERRGGAGGDNMLAQFPRGAATAESETVLDTAEESLKALGSSLALGTKIEQFVTHPGVAAQYLEVRGKRIATDSRPAAARAIGC